MLKAAVKNDGRNMLYFYSKDYQKRAIEIGLAEEKKLRNQYAAFMIPFVLVLVIAPVLIIAVWNSIRDFWTAYWQALLFLEVMNWFDGLILDKIWIAHSRIWKIQEMKRFPYKHSWGQIIKKRLAGTVLMAGVALIAWTLFSTKKD